MHRNRRLDDHEKFREWSALAQAGMLEGSELQDLQQHLLVCDPCREVYDEYSLISSEGMPLLAEHYSGHIRSSENWQDRRAWSKLQDRIREGERTGVRLVEPKPPSAPVISGLIGGRAWVQSLAACALVAIAAGIYHFGGRMHAAEVRSSAASTPAQIAASENRPAQELLDAEAAQIVRLEKQISGQQLELARLRLALRSANDRSNALVAASNNSEKEYLRTSEESDKLATQLRDAEQAYQGLQLEISSLRTEHDAALAHATALESKVRELSAATQEQERKLNDDEQYLASDRDIRELMGARKLYIADVFDVDSGSRTRKPYGRVFYTQNKSLIFYAFDLDREPGVKNASIFQVWGQRDNEAAEKAHPMNLGILYMDSESNRRWVLRLDDPKQLAEIDAVFVTVEPHAGSRKPTGKPLLYALLRKEANHP